MTLTPIKDLVREHCGLCFEEGRETILAEAVRTRLVKRELSSPEDYLGILSREPEEVRRLVSLVTINETYFFREEAHFRILIEQIIPEVRALRGEQSTLKIVSAGCSTGEEPYSIAIALHERFGPGFPARFPIVGFDIDEQALATARQGVYPAHSFRGVPDEIRARYFETEGGRSRIHRAVREGVTFLCHNICSDIHPEALRGADVVFYRNVSIYFEPEVRQRIFRNLAGLLNEKGCLFLSSTETFSHNVGVLSLVEKDGIFLYSKGFEMPLEERRKRPVCAMTAGAHPVSAAPLPKTAAAREVLSLRSESEPHRIFDEALRLAEAKKYDAALEQIGRVLAREPAFAKAFLLKAGILVNRSRFEEAEAACRQALALERWSLEGQLFLGLIAKIRGALPEAKQRFREAVYIRSSSWIAHFSLGEIHRLEGDAVRAVREFRIVIKLLEEKGAAEHGLRFFAISFPAEQIAHLCRHNIAALKGREG